MNKRISIEVRLSSFLHNTHSLNWSALLREEKLSQVRERIVVGDQSSFLSLGFTAAIGAHSISEEVAGFCTLRFPQGKLFVSLVSYDYCCACYSLR